MFIIEHHNVNWNKMVAAKMHTFIPLTASSACIPATLKLGNPTDGTIAQLNLDSIKFNNSRCVSFFSWCLEIIYDCVSRVFS